MPEISQDQTAKHARGEKMHPAPIDAATSVSPTKGTTGKKQ